jgi:protein-tyrosine phosphatase
MASILVVCTGNVCRSPIAEGFLRATLGERFGADAPTVASAGTAGWEGSAAMPESVTAAAERGVDISSHVARRLRPELVRDADLVVAMADEHRRLVIGASPQAAGRTFTLKELVRLLEAIPASDRSSVPDAALAERVRGAATLRDEGFAGNPFDEDVADPLGLPLETYRAIAWELDEWCGRLVDGLFGGERARSAAGAQGT